MPSLTTLLIVVAFVGVLLAQFLGTLCQEAAKAINSDMKIVNRLKFATKTVLATSAKRLLVPMLIMALVWLMETYSIGGKLLRSSVFGIGLLLSVAYVDILPVPRVIPLSWSMIYGGMFAAIMFLDRFNGAPLDSTLSLDLLKMVTDATVVVGTVLGVCMTILWTMDLRNLQDLELAGRGQLDYKEINVYRGLWALYMLILFVFVAACLAIWLGVPVIQRLGI